MTDLIAGISDNNVIGYNNDLPWRGFVPRDLPHFKEQTKDHDLIMGKITWLSIGSKPLPGRYCIIVSTTLDQVEDENYIIVPTFEYAYHIAKQRRKDISIIGGSRLWKEAIESNCIDRLLITRIHGEFTGDAYFPIDIASEDKYYCVYKTKWKEISPNFSCTFELWLKKITYP